MCSAARSPMCDVCADLQSEKSTSNDWNTENQSYDEKFHVSLCHIFWYANLTCHTYSYVSGDPNVVFDDLWPTASKISELLDCLCDGESSDLMLKYCRFAVRFGPVKLLQALLNDKLIDINHTFDDGRSLLHIACLSSNAKVVAFLITHGASLKALDNAGRTPDQLCFCPHTRKELPSRYQTTLRMHKKQEASFTEKEKIFQLSADSESFEDLQMMLHTLEFNVNRDRDPVGNLLLHRAVQRGMSHLTLIMNLVLVHHADVEAVNNKGMTPLCIAAHLGYGIIAEALICILGADPNTCCSLNHWTPLHFAAKKNNTSVTECLVRRDADLNVEDGFGFRADDIAKRVGNLECSDIIENLRFQRSQHLSYLAKKGNLTPRVIFPSDLCIVDSDGLTLVMVASKANRCDNLMVLLHSMKCPIDAQDAKFGRTALSWAAMSGKADAVQSLLRYSAHPGIRDANGMLPLHYACLHGHVQCAQLIVSTTKGLTGLQTAKKYAENPEICSIIHEAIYRRQKSIVNPTLFECAMNGDADRLYSTLEDGDNVNPLTGTGDWPMYMAVGNRHIKVMQLLYMNGGDIWSQHQTTGSTVLHIACSRGLYDIVSYLLRFSPVQTSSNSNCEDRQIDINAVNHLGLTALQVAAAKGFSRIVKLLLTHDASSALVNSQGQLYRCCEFEGVQVLIERSQRRRAEEIVKYIKSSSSLDQLIKVWQGKFDHNLRNRNGDTPLMVACLYGKTEAVEFLLRSAIQIVEEREQDIDLSLQSKGEQNDCFVDSGAFDGVSPGYPSSNNRSFVSVDKYCAEQDTWSSVTDLSDQDSEPHGHPEKQCRMFSSDLKGFSSSVNLQSRYLAKCNSYDAESLDSGDDTYKGPFHCPTSKKASLYRRNAFSSSDLNMQQSISDLREKNHASPRPASLDPSSCKIFQGTRVNHLCAVNMRDGCTAIHRAVECIDEQKGVTNLLLLIAKDCSVINLQNFQGLSPLHLAAKLERKQIVKTLTNLKSVDLNLRSSSGKLPEDMTRSKKIHHLIQDARQHWKEHRPLAQMEKLPMSPHGSVVGTSIDFDKLEKRFEQLRNSNNCDP